MFAPLLAHSPIGIHSLANHGKTVYFTITFSHDTATLHKQALAEIHAGNPPAHPRQLKKITGDRLVFTCCKKHFSKPFWSKLGHVWTLLAVVWLQKVSKTARQTPQNQPKMRQNHPKMVFGGILDRLGAISIPSVSISKGIKNKNFDRFWVPMGGAPLALIGWQRAPL